MLQSNQYTKRQFLVKSNSSLVSNIKLIQATNLKYHIHDYFCHFTHTHTKLNVLVCYFIIRILCISTHTQTLVFSQPLLRRLQSFSGVVFRWLQALMLIS
ncbi:hypothetical protein QVD17_03293 [Tagetes erecta]|uniref:Uncharacterized protein n=1 Tax=Tagetes erecta TaxID=13708 RepID=A0AAD8LFG8_TARER|nr:hypothetical protein QVD17_03293 [Tagetes erecta]